MGFRLDELPPEVCEFLTERHLATLAIVADGAVHASPVGFTWDPEARLARVITFASAKKVRLIEAAGSAPVALTQVDGGRWLTLNGTAEVSADEAVCADAVRRYGERYRPAGDRGADRRTIVIQVDQIMGRA